MTDVFISYKHRMRPRVDPIARELRALGLTVWYDEGLISGNDYAAVISSNLRSASCVLVCWTNDVFEHYGDTSGWVRGEAEKGRARGVLVCASLEPDVDLDPPFNTIQFSDLSAWHPETVDRAAWRSTLRAIGPLVGRPGLAAFDEAQSAGTSEALTAWAREYGNDPLSEAVWAKVEELAMVETRNRIQAERSRPKPAVAPAPTIQLRPTPARPEPASPSPAVSSAPAPAAVTPPPPSTAQSSGGSSSSAAATAPPHTATAATMTRPARSIWWVLAVMALSSIGGSAVGAMAESGASSDVGIPAIFGGLALSCAAYATLTLWMRVLTGRQAVQFFGALVVGAGVALLCLFAGNPSNDRIVAIASIFGAVGAAVPLIGLWLIMGRRRPALSILAIIVGTVLAGFVCSVGSSTTAVGGPDAAFIYSSVSWHIVFGFSVIWMLYLARYSKPAPVATGLT